MNKIYLDINAYAKVLQITNFDNLIYINKKIICINTKYKINIQNCV